LNIILDKGLIIEYYSFIFGIYRMLDEISLKILNILQEKARIPNVDVARQVGLAPSAVLERIRKLEKQGIIDGYEVRLNPKQFAKNLVAFVNVKIEQHGDEIAVGDKLSLIPEVQEVHYVAGDDSFLVKVRVADTEELGRLIRDKITTIKSVHSTRTGIVLSTYKETAKIPIDILPVGK
jgi:Lrp/AsnC family leucine-responsive transcriptional regulator